VTADWARPVVHWRSSPPIPNARGEFYRRLCNWEVGRVPSWASRPDWADPSPGPPATIRAGERPGVILYVQVRDLVASLVLAAELGATVVLGPFDVPGGPTLAAIEDPEGNPLTLVQQ